MRSEVGTCCHPGCSAVLRSSDVEHSGKLQPQREALLATLRGDSDAPKAKLPEGWTIEQAFFRSGRLLDWDDHLRCPGHPE